MHQNEHAQFQHSHDFVRDFSRAEFRTRIVIGITVAMMVLEITAGIMSHSMALLADGWHMSTHAIAFVIAAVAYHFTRRHANDPRFSFGTGKIGVLGGYSSAIVLSLIALAMAGESIHRLFSPLSIHFNEAIGIAALGLCVNIVCAFLLKDDPTHQHHHDHGHEHGHDSPGAHHHDLNLRAAYVHVLADAFTSILAISALASGKFFGWGWLDPVVGIVGSAVVFSWAYTLVRDTGTVLLDVIPSTSDLPVVIQQAIESDGDSVVTDLHIWQLSSGTFAAIISIVAHEPKSCEAYRALLLEHEELVHVTIETQHCHDHEEQAISA
ncbi:MAG: CDF family Co(II)/Ni(II) efflux transporter DmeF [Chthoniobacterales bacterium]